MISKWPFFLGCFALLMFLVITSEADARGRGGGGGRSVSRSGPASGGSVRGNKRDVRDNRQDRRGDVRDDRRDFREDRYDDRRRARRRRRVGSVLTRSTFRSLNCHSTLIIVGNVTYYRCGTYWYNRAYSGGDVTYVIVTAPAGY